MNSRIIVLPMTILAIVVFGWLAEAFAQNTNTTAVPSDRTQLPQPDPKFKGTIGETFKDSTPNFPQPVRAPKGSPNVLLIMLDDVGFGMCSTFGGPVPTPHMDQLANSARQRLRHGHVRQMAQHSRTGH